MLRADLPAVLAIEVQANPVPWMAVDFDAFLREPVQLSVPYQEPAGQGIVAAPGLSVGAGRASGPMGWVWANPEVQGFACVVAAADEAELQSIAVAQDRWGRGVGSALMEVLCAWARENGFLNLHLEVREGNVRAREFYARWGFAPSGRRAKYYRDNAEAAVLMSKTLLETGEAREGKGA